MNLDTYQTEAISFALPQSVNTGYLTLGLCGEAGEVAEKIKKSIRDNSGIVTPAMREDLAKEIGDVLWYVANLADCLGLSLDDIGQMNLDKLQSRKDRNKLQGSGDNR